MNASTVFAVSAVVAVAAAVLGWFLNDRLGARSVLSAKLKAEEFQRAANREAENIKRQQIVEARDQIIKEKTKADSDLRSRKGQVAKRERDLKQAQDALLEAEAELQRQREARRPDQLHSLLARDVRMTPSRVVAEHTGRKQARGGKREAPQRSPHDVLRAGGARERASDRRIRAGGRV